ncbi:hypothetical protein QR680_015587 [Steinernema hermaphroditum]|uniref:Uncharacterized protein n=1 Tax=Steinernema hermaphroditum TaxID=289476 RepID=A0AA39LL59_9BILA|nr:hypothetical protein QR680_015587 [Steinernema hermaphroditum]
MDDNAVTNEKSIGLYRSLLLVNVVISIPLNVLAVYLIIYKSPSHMKTYKYVLLNISFWAFLADVFYEIILIPIPYLDVFGVYSAGLARWFGPFGGFLCLV